MINNTADKTPKKAPELFLLPKLFQSIKDKQKMNSTANTTVRIFLITLLLNFFIF